MIVKNGWIIKHFNFIIYESKLWLNKTDGEINFKLIKSENQIIWFFMCCWHLYPCWSHSVKLREIIWSRTDSHKKWKNLYSNEWSNSLWVSIFLYLTVWFMAGLAGRAWSAFVRRPPGPVLWKLSAFGRVRKGFCLWILFKDTYQRELHNDFKQKDEFRADPSLNENRFSLTLWRFWKIKIYNLRITGPIKDWYLIESCAGNLFITAQCVVIYGQRGYIDKKSL